MTQSSRLKRRLYSHPLEIGIIMNKFNGIYTDLIKFAIIKFYFFKVIMAPVELRVAFHVSFKLLNSLKNS